MGGRQDADLGRDGPQIGLPPAVDADALLDDALAHQLLGERPDGLADLLLAAGELARRLGGAGELGDGGVGHLVDGGVAVGLEGDRDRAAQLVGGDPLDRIEHVGGVVHDGVERDRGDRPVGGDHAGDELALQADGLLDPLLRRLEAAGEDGFVDLRCALLVVLEALLAPAGLDHHDRDVAVAELAPGDDELERAGIALGVGRVRDPLAVGREGEAHRADRAVERDAADHQGRGRGVDGQDVVGVLLVGADDGDDDLGLVAEAVSEAGAQRPVGEAAGQDGVLGGPPLPAEERAGDLARGVGPLLDVDGEGEEVDAGAHVVAPRWRWRARWSRRSRRRRRPGSAGRACRSRR